MDVGMLHFTVRFSGRIKYKIGSGFTYIKSAHQENMDRYTIEL
jgi:hypothetical protein